MNSREKDAFSDEAYKALHHSLVVGVMEELCLNLGIPFDGLPAYGLRKVGLYVAIVARAQALGIDPDTLRMTDAETAETQRDLMRAAHEAGKPVIALIVEGDNS